MKLLLAATSLASVSAYLRCDMASIPPCRQADGSLLTQTVDDSTGCPSCVAFTDCSKVTIPPCGATEKPSINLSTGCPTCTVPLCDATSFSKVPDCIKDERPSLDTATGCPTCKLNVCTEAEAAAVPLCRAGEAPTLDTASMCPTCRPGTVCTKIASDLPLCLAGVSPSLNLADGCPTCRVHVCDFSLLTRCAAGADPVLDANKCPSCIPSIEFVPCQIAPSDLRTCFADERPTLDTTTRCYSCRPPAPVLCTKDPRTIPECADAERPTFDATRCPSCRPANGRPETPECPAEAIRKCQQAIRNKLIRECAVDEEPRRDPGNCCVSCVDRVARCDAEALKRCHALSTTDGALKPCADRDELAHAWNPDTCCMSCTRPPATSDELPTGTLADNRCTPEAVRACRAKTPVCESREQALALRALAGDNLPRCCAVCQQAPPSCTLVDRVKCARATDECADGERSIAVRGECCRSCRPAPIVRPTNAVCAACTDAQACLRGPDGQPKCVSRRALRKRVTLATKVLRDQLRDLPDADKAAFVREQVESFCDQQIPRVQLLCQRFKDALRDGVRVRTRPGQTDDSDAGAGRTDKQVDIEFDVPLGDDTVLGEAGDYTRFTDNTRLSSAGRRLTAETAVQDALTEVICASADGFGSCVDWSDSAVGVSGASVAQPVAALMAALALFF